MGKKRILVGQWKSKTRFSPDGAMSGTSPRLLSYIWPGLRISFWWLWMSQSTLPLGAFGGLLVSIDLHGKQNMHGWRYQQDTSMSETQMFRVRRK